MAKMIIDCDAGVDDCQAIMLALSRSDWEILAITCVCGNTSVDNAWKNVLRVLTICGRTEIPVFKGASHPLLYPCSRSSSYHGEDGLAGYSKNVEINESLVQSANAVPSMVKIVNDYPGEVTVVALAPLTNLALAHRLDPSFSQKVKHLCIMGGNLSGRGCSALAAEFNFVCDPESAYITMSEFTCPIVIVPYETCLDSEHIFEWAWCHKWISTKTAKGHFLKGIINNDLINEEIVDQLGMHSCDLLAMAVAIEPTIITKKESRFSQVEISGKITRGQMVVDWNNILAKPSNVDIVLKINLPVFKKMCEEMVK